MQTGCLTEEPTKSPSDRTEPCEFHDCTSSQYGNRNYRTFASRFDGWNQRRLDRHVRVHVRVHVRGGAHSVINAVRANPFPQCSKLNGTAQGGSKGADSDETVNCVRECALDVAFIAKRNRPSTTAPSRIKPDALNSIEFGTDARCRRGSGRRSAV